MFKKRQTGAWKKLTGGPKAVLLDMDGVVADSMRFHVRAWQEAFGHYGLQVSSEALYLNEGAIALDTVRGLNDGHIDEELAENISRLQKAIFEEKYLPGVRLYPDAHDFLEGLRLAGAEAALVSGSAERSVLSLLSAEVRCYFSTVICGDRCSRPKPHPEPYLLALRELGLAAAECLAVENSPAGITSARAAGLRCYGLSTTLTPEHLSGAWRVFGSLAELGRHLHLPAAKEESAVA
ncbi:MAG: HAD family phosphatase [Pseudomonadota bacterium]